VTTIAYRNGVMAGDSLATTGGTRFCGIRKVHKLANGALLGVTGDVTRAMRLVRALHDTQGRLNDDVSDLARKCDGVYVHPKGTVWVLEGGGFYEAFAEFLATGSGMDYALAAMKMGAGARKAVEVACELDIYSGAPVDVVKL
jgi:ATP-dependent protease HslVU (ClpYQ) peptidase subunit